MVRKTSNKPWEADLAMIAVAGLRILKQTSVAPGASANVAYTVTEGDTRRVACIHIGTGNGDIRFKYNAAAAATDIPLIPALYVIVDATKDDTVQFFNTTAGAITVHLLELT